MKKKKINEEIKSIPGKDYVKKGCFVFRLSFCLFRTLNKQCNEALNRSNHQFCRIDKILGRFQFHVKLF